jgi:hypothetical protein
MRKVVRSAWLLGVAVAVAAGVAGCASTPSSPVATPWSRAVSPSSPAAAGPLGMLPIPWGATPWTSNTDAPMSLAAFISAFYIASAQVHEKSLYTRRGWVSGGMEGWINLDGSQQRIAIARFATANGAISAFDDLSSALAEKPASWTVLSDSADGAVGAVNPQLDADGNAFVDVTAHVGDYLVDVHEYTAMTPDPASAKALLLKQFKALESVATKTT